PLATRTAWSVSGTARTTAIGPNTSCWASRASGARLSTRVGATNQPEPAPGGGAALGPGGRRHDPAGAVAGVAAGEQSPAAGGGLGGGLGDPLAGLFGDDRPDDGSLLGRVADGQALDGRDQRLGERGRVADDDGPAGGG